MNTSLPRTLTFRDLVLLIVGTVIGSGIFLVPGPVLRDVQQHVGLALLVWIVGGVLSLLGALTYGELGAMKPQAGGLYVYIRDTFGRPMAFIYGWALFFMISSGSVATLAVAFGTYLGQIVLLTAFEAKLIAVGMIGVVAAVNVLGTRKSANLQNVATAIKVVAILAMSAVLLLSHRSVPSEPVLETGGSLMSGFGLAMISVLWAYEGWQYCTFSAGETVDPQRSFPRAFLVGSISLIVIYVVANLGYVTALGSAGAAASNSVAAEAIRVVLGPFFGKLIAVAILVSIFSAANGLTLTSPRVYYAMANDGVFFRKLAEVHPRFRTPALAVVAGSAWAAVLAASGTFEQLLTYVVFTGWIFYGLGAAAVFVYRRREPDTPRPYRVPGYPFTPLLFVIAAAALVLNTVVAEPRRALVGLVLVITGVPVYLIWQRRGAPSKALSAPRA
ncbi:MAG: amino acid permease [Terriglobia bacterium]|nr:amino acid permease [Terriglobia bacterium]